MRLLGSNIGRTALLGAAMAVVLGSSTAFAQSTSDQERIERLEQLVEQLTEQVKQLQATQQPAAPPSEPAIQTPPTLEEEIRAAVAEEVEEQLDDQDRGWGGDFEIGGYAEFHANFNQGDDGDQFDIHRFVLDFSYDFEDWIKFFAELEIEHAFINDGDGEVVLEQFYVDFLLSDKANVRLGRVLAPLGIINKYHEPNRFNGVERPFVDQVIIPTTWSVDGGGVFGKITDSLAYELYVVGGLDGTGFSPTSGIRGGRIKERPSINDLAVTGRVDWFPFVNFTGGTNQTLRIGASAFHGGLDNGDQGNDPDISGTEITLASADFEYTYGRFDLRGVGAYTWIDGAEKLPMGIGEEQYGWYLEPAVHVMPEKWKQGKFSESDLVLFTRYEDIDTQHETVRGVARVPGGDREVITFGANFYVTQQVVLKADYQIIDPDGNLDNEYRWNLGLGMQF